MSYPRIDMASIRNCPSGGKSQMALFQIMIFSAISVWIVDWTVKALPKASWWVPHQTERSWAGVPLAWLLLLMMVSIIGKRWVAWAAGVAGGGLVANIVDLKLNGVVWNMIPIPYAQGLTCNVADFAIVGGFVALLIGVGIRYAELCRQPA